MYQINPTTNELIELSEQRFADLGFKEREHLQEWLAKCPTALGEELLIIQKEFDGFDETRERLDLLALDKQGNLVLIENKLDDSGKDVVWQSLKYASYCSSLKKADIERIYQAYLDRYEGGGKASERIVEFLEADEFSDVILNSGTDQRIKLVAANFRREVTSTVLWLLQYGLQIQCYKATPFKHGEDLFLNIEQIIPTPEAADFMIGITEKEKEQKQVERGLSNAQSLRHAFWELALEGLQKAGVTLYQNISPSRDHWLSAGSGLSGINYAIIFSKSETRVEFNIARGTPEENKQIFDSLHAQKEAIEASFGSELVWLRLDHRKASRIEYQKSFDGYDKENWPEMVAWLIQFLPKMERTFSQQIEVIRRDLRQG
jgi:hypothetical protein